MNKQIEHILLGLLWLLAATLGTTFWLNTNFGFNIFSAQHWEYLSYLQAARTPVRPMFYISLVVATLIAIAGLYMTMCTFSASGATRRCGWLSRLREAHRNRNTARVNANSDPDASTIDITATQPQAPTITTPAETMTATPDSPITPTMPSPPRPPRLNITPSAAPLSSSAPVIKTAVPSDKDLDELRQIFTDAGYIIKDAPRIGNYKPALMAIGADENVWIGDIKVSPEKIQTAMDKLSEVFADTLDDIEIAINGFVVSPTEPVSSDAIMSFDDIEKLREYISSHPNTPPAKDDQSTFDAYSEYIDTVIKFIGTM